MIMHVTFDSLKTFYNILVQKLKNHRGNWNQNDPAADDYIKNRPFYSEVENVILVDNLTQSAYYNGEHPNCTFVIGQAYNITWNGTLYENMVCTLKDGWCTLTSDVFYIDDDGGNSLYVETDDTNWTLSISTTQEIIKKLDKKFIDVPDDIVTGEKFDEFQDTVDNHIYNINNPHNVTAGQIGAAPMSHASTAMTYGLGNSDRYGHVKLSDSINSTEGPAYGIAATPKAVSTAYSLATNHANNKSNPHDITISQIGAASESHTHPYLRYLDATAKMPISTNWLSIAYGNGKFVAVGGAYPTYYVAYSSDGIAWHETTLPKYMQPCSIAYGNGKFVVIDGYDTYNAIHYAAYSSDGITWNTTTLPKDIQTSFITYGNGKFVAIDSGTDKAIYSSDGITWNETTLPISGNWSSIAYGNGKFVAVIQNSDKVIYSSDGITWNETTLLNNLRASYIVYGGDKFVVVSTFEYCRSAYSSDGITWNEAVFNSNNAFADIVTYGDGKFVALSYGISFYSLDGITWNRSDLPIGNHWSSITYGNGRFITVAKGSNIVLYSEDGINWKREYTGIMQDGINIDLESIGLATEEYVDNATVQSDWNQNDETALDFIKNKPDILTSDVLNGKMDAENPVGSGTFSMGRMEGTTIGAASFTHGAGAEASGFHSFAKGLYPKASGEYSHAEGYSVAATGDHSYSFGNWATATGKYSYSFGEDTKASSNYSHAEGYRSIATTDKNESVTVAAYGLYNSDYQCAHAEGYGTVACGIGSHTEGLSTKAEGEGSHAEGRQTLSSGTASHAEGYNTTASSISSHAEGQRTLASGDNSHAEGLYTKASGTNSHAEGEYSEASSENQHVEGKYNALDENNQFVHIIGNGTYSTRSNAHTVDWDGNAWYSGDVYVGSTSGVNKDEGSKKLATEEYVNTSIANLSSFSPDEMLNTLNELNAAIQENDNAIDALNAAIQENDNAIDTLNATIANKITVPQNAVAGDLLTYDGTNWVCISRADLIAEIIAALPRAEEATF